jgi:hypothetical protein
MRHSEEFEAKVSSRNPEENNNKFAELMDDMERVRNESVKVTPNNELDIQIPEKRAPGKIYDKYDFKLNSIDRVTNSGPSHRLKRLPIHLLPTH